MYFFIKKCTGHACPPGDDICQSNCEMLPVSERLPALISRPESVYILYLTTEFLYGIFLMTKLKILKHIFLLREKQNLFTYYLINVNKL